MSTLKGTSKNTDPRFEDVRVTDSSGNVFVDLGFDPAEARVMALRVQLMVSLRERLEADGLTQKEAAIRLGVTQPRVSSLMRGAWKDFSMDMLLTLAERAGLHPQLRLG
jgi:predicted XRE-type DNA-binding protein